MTFKSDFIFLTRARITFSFLLLLYFFIAGHSLQAQSFEDNYRKLDSLYQAGDFEQVLKMEPLIVSQIDQRQDTLVANSYFYIGDAYLGNYEMETALSYFNRERDMRKKLLPLDPVGYSNALYNLMFTYMQDSQDQLAIQTGNELLEFDKNTYSVNSSEYVGSYLDYIEILLEMDQWSLAEEQTKSLMTSLPKTSGLYARAEAKLGDVYAFKGLYSKSSRCFSSALPVIAAAYGDESEDYQTTLSSYANLLMAQGKYDQAEEILSNSLQTIQESSWLSKDFYYYTTLNNLSLIYQSLGQYASAEKSLQTVLKHDSVTIGTDSQDFAISLSNLGQLYTYESKYIESENALQAAISTLVANGETQSVSYATLLNNLARNFQVSGQPTRAIPLLDQALAIFKELLGENSPEYATSLFNLGVAQLSINPSVGFSYLKKAEVSRRKILGKKHSLYAETLEKMALYQWKKRNKKEVSKLLGLVFENYFNQVTDFFPVLTEEEKSNLFFNTIRPSQELYASWVTSEHASDPLVLGELYNITLNTKGLIFYATDRVRQKIQQSADSTLVNLYETWESQKELLAFYYSTNQDPDQIDSLVAVSKSTEKELSRRSAEFSRDIIRPQRSWKEIQSILKPGEAAVEIVRFRSYDVDSLKFSKTINYAILILTSSTTKGPELVLKDNGGLLENRFLSYYRNGIQFKLDNEYSYGNYFETIHDALKRHNIKTLFLSSDGAYNMISLGSIKNPFTQKYLIEELDIRLVTSTRDLLEPPVKKTSGQSSLLIGFPTYNLKSVTKPRNATDQSNKVVSRSIRGALSRFASGENGIKELPGTKIEVEKISATLSVKYPTEVLTEWDATESNIKKLNSPGILHIATHGYFLEDEISPELRTPNPLLNSGLILAGATNFIQYGGNPLHGEDDGILTAYEAMNLNLVETDFVVLSACETGLGVVQNGEGVYGLQRAFQLAGANYVIMSLWPVDDEATQVLMANFYKNWMEREDVRGAFMEAQLETKLTYPNPFYWGAFILVGK